MQAVNARSRLYRLFVVLLLSGCGLVDPPDLLPDQITVDFVEPEVKMVNGQIFMRWKFTCISLDIPSIPNDWSTLEEVDQSRITEYTFEEIENCNV